MQEPRIHLAVALDGAGWHPAAWRAQDARPDELLTARYWADLVQEAERGQLDFVTIEDSLGLQADDERTDQVRGRLDAVLIASRVAPVTQHIGLVPTVVATHTEPFHISKAIATLDYVSGGRAGLRLVVSADQQEAAHFGRRDFSVPSPGLLDELLDEAADYAEVVRGLWDSWEDDAEIRDVATGRFIDREKLHYIDFVGKHFSVKGPSITPRPPQGQPLIAGTRHTRGADLVFVTPQDADSIAAEVPGTAAQVFADLVVFLDDTVEAATARKAQLDEWAGSEFSPDAHVFVGTPSGLADLLVSWSAEGLTGFRLHPGALPHDLTAIAGELVVQLRQRGVFRDAYEAPTLRGLLGLNRPANRYAVGGTVR